MSPLRRSKIIVSLVRIGSNFRACLQETEVRRTAIRYSSTQSTGAMRGYAPPLRCLASSTIWGRFSPVLTPVNFVTGWVMFFVFPPF